MLFTIKVHIDKGPREKFTGEDQAKADKFIMEFLDKMDTLGKAISSVSVDRRGKPPSITED